MKSASVFQEDHPGLLLVGTSFARNLFCIISSYCHIASRFKRFLKDACVKSGKVFISILTLLVSLSGS